VRSCEGCESKVCAPTCWSQPGRTPTALHAILDVPARRESNAFTVTLPMHPRGGKNSPCSCASTYPNACHNVWKACGRRTSFTAYASSTRIATRGPDSKPTETRQYRPPLSESVGRVAYQLYGVPLACLRVFIGALESAVRDYEPVYPSLTSYTAIKVRILASQHQH
jgi:hypothetical protein